MEKVLYRSLTREDYKTIKYLINKAFGFDEFLKDDAFLDSALNIYLQECILSSNFSKVAVKNNKVIGIILGSAKNDKNKLRKPSNYLSALASLLKIAFAKKENKKDLKEFSKIQNIYNEMIKDKENEFQGCIQLFIVSEESRGLGVGKALLNQLFNYMTSMKVTSLYLYTDTRCNYGFYDSQNFKRLMEKELKFQVVPETLKIFLYGYTF
ncbi:MAG: GNAT family N-acetyltransferase [Clostridium sp.]|nr:GNAT family N-acetyltransferase [Clostridium sp.]MDU7083563.1 GNAT family N-acetyltransferase [Clostridium sp.]